MKTKLFLAAITVTFSLALLCLFSCKSKPSLKGYRTTEIGDSLDTIPVSRLNNYTETIEKTYILGCILIRTGGSTSSSSLLSLNVKNRLWEIKDAENPLYNKSMQRLIFNPDVSYKVDSKYMGIYQHRKTVIEGIEVSMLSEKERKFIESK